MFVYSIYKFDQTDCYCNQYLYTLSSPAYCTVIVSSLNLRLGNNTDASIKTILLRDFRTTKVVICHSVIFFSLFKFSEPRLSAFKHVTPQYSLIIKSHLCVSFIPLTAQCPEVVSQHFKWGIQGVKLSLKFLKGNIVYALWTAWYKKEGGWGSMV